MSKYGFTLGRREWLSHPLNHFVPGIDDTDVESLMSDLLMSKVSKVRMKFELDKGIPTQVPWEEGSKGGHLRPCAWKAEGVGKMSKDTETWGSWAFPLSSA